MKAKLLIVICILLTGKAVYPQAIYTMPVSGTQTDTVCGGIFYDSGGPVGNYAPSENGILIFCPAITGQFVVMEFTSINLNDAGDRLRIFHGTDTTSIPLFNLAGPTSSAGCGTVIVANDSSGCLTVHFRSDGSANSAGWKARLYCNPVVSPIIPGTTCANPVSIPSIPFMDSGCTECMLNDYQSQAGICNVSYGGEDIVYRYTATGTESICITLSNATTNTRLAVYDGCPGSSAVNCLTPVPMVGNDSLQVTLPSAGTYYIIIDEPSGYSCYDLSITPPCMVGIDEEENSSDGVLVFPNPSKNELDIRNSVFGDRIEFTISNFLGEIIYADHQTSDIGHRTINIADLPPGIYFLNITDENNRTVRKKFVKI